MTETKTDLDVSIEEVTHAVAEITKMDAVIAKLTAKYDKVIFDVDTNAGMRSAKSARKEIRDPRYLIESLRKDGKAPILDLGRKLDGRANEMKDRLLAIEEPIDATIKAEETRVERERQKKIDAEAKRLETIQEHISDIRSGYEKFTRFDVSADQIQVQIKDLEELEITEALFQEFVLQANEAKSAVLVQLRDAHAAAIEREESNRKAAEAQAELDKLKKANEEREAKERVERKKAEAEDRKKQEAEDKKRRTELEAQQKKQAEEQARIDAEAKKLADEKAELERQQKEMAKEKRISEEAKQAEIEDARKRKVNAEALAKQSEYPGEEAIVNALASHFDVSITVAKSWLIELRKAA